MELNTPSEVESKNRKLNSIEAEQEKYAQAAVVANAVVERNIAQHNADQANKALQRCKSYTAAVESKLATLCGPGQAGYCERQQLINHFLDNSGES